MSEKKYKSSKVLNIAINGFGRIGRSVFKAFLEKNINAKIVAINDLTDTKTLANLLKYDSVYGKYEGEVNYTTNSLIVNNSKYKVLAERDPANLHWRDMDVDIVLECTGRFRTRELVSPHLQSGAKWVIMSAPAKDDKIKTIVLGVNESKIKKTDKILSNASCTTNCLAPITAIIKENFGITKAIMTTIHSYTADQNLVDGPHKDLRRARAAALNIIPTTTGAAIATTKTIPSLSGRFDGMSVRVPTPVGSLTDAVFLTRKKINEDDVRRAMKKAVKSARFKNIIRVSEEPLVSSDIVGDPSSAIIDLPLIKVVDGNLLKVVAWYDNEWGYSNRMIDLVDYLIKKKLI